VHTSSGRIRFGLLVAAATMLLTITAPSAAAAPTLRGAFGGEAFGSYSNAATGDLATTLGRSSHVQCPCDGTNGSVLTNQVNQVNGRGDQRFSSGAQRSTVFGNKTAAAATGRSSSTAKDLRMLNGAITATSVKGMSNVVADPNSIAVNDNGSSFLDLSVLGQALGQPAQNTRIDLPHLGYVLIREVITNGTDQHKAILVNMIHAFITQSNDLGLPVGSEIVVGRARSMFTRAEPATILNGYAFGSTWSSTSQQADNDTGRSAPSYLSCLTSGDHTNTNSAHDTTYASGLGGVGTERTSIRGVVAPTSMVVATSTASAVNLFGGLIKADKAAGVAKATWNNASDQGDTSTAGSSFVNLVVNGQQMPDVVAPNTRVDLPGVGYVILRETLDGSTAGRSAVRVNMIHVYVTAPGVVGMPAGSNLKVAIASASARPF
jgi:hypothetical protein